MKPNYLTLKTSLLITLFTYGNTHSCFAQGNGTRGGGQTVVTPSGRELRDLINPICAETVTGLTLLGRMPELKNRIETLKQIHWYFGFSLERELKGMSFCFTDLEFNEKNMPYIPSEHTILATHTPDHTEVTAVRIFETLEAYINRPRFDQISSDRDARLRNFVFALNSLETSDVHALEKLKVAITFNRIDFPTESRIVRGAPYLEFVLSSPDERRQKILDGEITVHQILYPSFNPSVERLLAGDSCTADFVFEHPAIVFNRYCEDQDDTVLNKIRAQSTEHFDIDTYCLALPATEVELRGTPTQTTLNAIGARLKKRYSALNGVTATLEHSQIALSGDINFLTPQKRRLKGTTIGLTLLPLINPDDHDSMPIETQEWFGVVIRLAQIMEVDQWLNIISQNGALETALNPKRVIQAVQNLPGTMPDEQKALIAWLPRIYQSFKDSVEYELRSQDLDDYADAWKKLTHI